MKVNENVISLIATLVLAVILFAVATNNLDDKIQETSASEETSIQETTTEEATTEETTTPIYEGPTNVTTATIEYLGEYRVTAYCPCSKCCGKWANGITSTGVTATEGRTIAVDPKIIPYGSILEINGQRYVAEDCGGAIKDKRLDIFFNSHEDALKWGVQYHDVYLITE